MRRAARKSLAHADLDPRLEPWIRRLTASRLGMADAGSVRLEVERLQDRARSRIAWIHATVDGREVNLLLKQLLGPGESSTGPNRLGRDRAQRPRLAAPSTFGERYRLEFEALRATEKHIAELGNPGLVAVPVLGYLTEPHSLLMERIEGSNLRDLTQQSLMRLHGPRAELDPAIRLAGSWLRTYHAIPGAWATRHARRADVIDFIVRLCDFLGRNLGREEYFGALADRLSSLAARALESELPVGLAHGDFAPRNVLVLSGQRVAVLDMAAGTAIPVYEDLAYFLASLRTPLARALSQGMLHDEPGIEHWERVLAESYFDPAPAPWPAIRLYQVLVILDKWWGTPPRLPAGIRATVTAAAAGGLIDRFFRKEIETLLRLADKPGPHAGRGVT